MNIVENILQSNKHLNHRKYVNASNLSNFNLSNAQLNTSKAWDSNLNMTQHQDA